MSNGAGRARHGPRHRIGATPRARLAADEACARLLRGARSSWPGASSVRRSPRPTRTRSRCPSREVDTFLHAWGRDDPADMATLLDRPARRPRRAASSLVEAVPGSTATYTRTGLSAAPRRRRPPRTTPRSRPRRSRPDRVGRLARARAHASSAGWRITWSPSDLYPGLGAGHHLDGEARLAGARVDPRRRRHACSRASGRSCDRPRARPHQDAGRSRGGEVRDAVAARRRPARRSTRSCTRRACARLLPAGDRPCPRRRQYQHIHDTLVPIPGIIFRRDAGRASPPTPPRVAESSARVGDDHRRAAEAARPAVRGGDQVGLSGLQSAFEKRLAGTPRTDVVIVDAKRRDRAHDRSGSRAGAPQPVRLTIDPATQQAAETALAGVTKNAALVAIDTTTGAIRAVVSKPYGGFDRALAGTYPPGSTFKVITSAALLARGRQRLRPRRRARRRSPSTGARSRTSKARRRARSTSRARSRSRATTRSSASPTNSPPTRSPRPRPCSGSTRTGRSASTSAAARTRSRRTAPSARRRRSGRDACSRARCRWRRSRPRSRPGAGTRRCSSPSPARRRPSVPPLDPIVVSTLQSFMAERRPAGRDRGRLGPPRRLVRQDGHRRVRQRQPAAHARLVHRVPRRPRLRGDRRRRRRRREGRRAARGRVPRGAAAVDRAAGAGYPGPMTIRGVGVAIGPRSRSSSWPACADRRRHARSASGVTDLAVDRRARTAAPTTHHAREGRSRTTRRSRSTSAARRASRPPSSTAPRRWCADDRRPAQVPDPAQAYAAGYRSIGDRSPATSTT